MISVRRFLTTSGTVALWLAAISASVASAQAPDAARTRHSWGRFKPGAWKQVRVETDTFDEKGQFTGKSVTETLTTLEAVTDRDFTLRVEVTVDVAGKRFSSQPQVIRQGYYGEAEGQKVQVRKVGEGNLTLSGRVIPCEVREVVINGGEAKRVTTVHYSDRIAPFFLKRESVTTDAEGKPANYQSQSEVVMLDMPCKIFDETKNVFHVKTVQKQPKATVTTLEVQCESVPGGVISHSLREEDDKGRTLRRSTLELIDFGYGSPNDDPSALTRRPRLFQRNRSRTPESTRRE